MGVIVRQKVRGKGRPWWVFVSVDCRRWTKKVGDRGAAEAVASAVRRQIKAGAFQVEPSRQSPDFVGYARRYVETYARTACKWSTHQSYRVILDKHIAPAWRGLRLDQITRGKVKALLLERQQAGFAPGTVRNIQVFISGVFTHAYEDGIIAANPALKLGRYIRKDDRRRHVSPLTRDQVSAFLATARQECRAHYPLLLCAFRTGMRLGELMGLAWDDIDFVANTIEVRRSYSHGHFSTPKSHKSRLVDISDQLKRTLLDHQRDLLARFGGKLPEARAGEEAVHFAFPNRGGGPTDGDDFRRRVFYRLIEKADVPRFRIHDIRHTFASLLLQQGESLHYVREQMGHASIQTTVDVYGHLVPGSNRNAVNRLDDPALRLARPSAG